MLSEEEKQAIEIFTNLVNYLERWNKNLTIIPEDKKYYKTLLNLITKLQEESTKKDKRLNRQFKLLNKKDKEIAKILSNEKK